MTGLRINHSIILLLVFQFAQQVTMDPFQPVSSSCRYWDSLSLYKYSDTKVLHCILDENDQLGIVNATWKWVEPGYCPYFDRQSEEVHVKPCDAELGMCPVKEIYSFQGVIYSACYRTLDRSQKTLNVEMDELDNTASNTQNKRNTNEKTNNLIGIDIAISLIVLLAMLGIYSFEKIQVKGLLERMERGGYYGYNSIPQQPVDTPRSIELKQHSEELKTSPKKSEIYVKESNFKDSLCVPEKDLGLDGEGASGLLGEITTHNKENMPPKIRRARKKERIKEQNTI